jgi:threonine dehydrogenase-like Zn-dependent dehydrogenase
MMEAEKAIALVRFPQRLKMAKKFAKAQVINSQKVGKMPN